MANLPLIILLTSYLTTLTIDHSIRIPVYAYLTKMNRGYSSQARSEGSYADEQWRNEHQWRGRNTGGWRHDNWKDGVEDDRNTDDSLEIELPSYYREEESNDENTPSYFFPYYRYFPYFPYLLHYPYYYKVEPYEESEEDQ